MLHAGNADRAAVILNAHLGQNPADHEAWHLLSLAEMQPQRRQYFRALKAIRQALKIAPEDIRYQGQLGFALMNMGRFDEAILQLQPLLETKPNDYFLLHALQMAYCRYGKNDEAIALGRRILQLEHSNALAHKPGPPLEAEASASRGPLKVIAYSLWGAIPAYNPGAMINARLSPFFYPDWECRFYVGADVPASTVSALKHAGATVIEAAVRHADVAPAMWRFLVADDPQVAVFLCRDCDARLTPKEAAAVDAWLVSGKRAHVMRDHVMHRNLMLAGLWGAHTDRPLQVAARIRRFTGGKVVGGYGADQLFLAREIWPEIRDDCLLHDSHYDLFGAQSFPVMGKGDDRFHVGMGVTDEQVLQRECRLLGLTWPLA